MLFEEEEEEKTVKQAPKNSKTVKRYGSYLHLICSVANTRPGKREFDRHSGTGRGQECKDLLIEQS